MRELRLRIKSIKITYQEEDTGKEFISEAVSGKSNIKNFLWSLIRVYYEYYKPIIMTKKRKQPIITINIEDKPPQP